MRAATLTSPVATPPLVGIHDLLFATDLSPESDAAFDHVRLIAERFGADVTLYHAVEVLDDRYPGWRRVLGSNTERVVRHAPCPVLVA